MNGNGNDSSSTSSPAFSSSSNDYPDELSAGLADIEEGMTERKKQRVRAGRYKPFPATDKLIPYRGRPDLNIDVNDVPTTHVESIFLAFLHCFVLLGSTVAVPTVIVPLMGGGKEEKAQLILNFIFAAGITTLLHSYVGTRLPVVMGSSYAYLIPAMSVAMSKSEGPRGGGE